mgnify:CR=1 FL=1
MDWRFWASAIAAGVAVGELARGEIADAIGRARGRSRDAADRQARDDADLFRYRVGREIDAEFQRRSDSLRAGGEKP